MFMFNILQNLNNRPYKEGIKTLILLDCLNFSYI